jgi:hypothetical protein
LERQNLPLAKRNRRRYKQNPRTFPIPKSSGAAVLSQKENQILTRVVDQLVKEKYFESVFGPPIRKEQQRRQAQAFGR